MNILLFMIPLALFLGGLGLAGFLWSLKSGQYEDLDGAARRILLDDDLGERAGVFDAQAGRPSSARGETATVTRDSSS